MSLYALAGSSPKVDTVSDVGLNSRNKPIPDNQEATLVNESRDGVGSADHDQPYTFGNRLSSAALSPFTFREYIRLQMLRGRFEDPTWPMARDTPDISEPVAA